MPVAHSQADRLEPDRAAGELVSKSVGVLLLCLVRIAPFGWWGSPLLGSNRGRDTATATQRLGKQIAVPAQIKASYESLVFFFCHPHLKPHFIDCL